MWHPSQRLSEQADSGLARPTALGRASGSMGEGLSVASDSGTPGISRRPSYISWPLGRNSRSEMDAFEAEELRFVGTRRSTPAQGGQRRVTDYMPSHDCRYNLVLRQLGRPSLTSAPLPQRLLSLGEAACYQLRGNDGPLTTLHLAAPIEAGSWSPRNDILAISALVPPPWWQRLVPRQRAQRSQQLVLLDVKNLRLMFVGHQGSGGHRLEWSASGHLLAVHRIRQIRGEGRHVVDLWRLGGDPGQRKAPTRLSSNEWPSPVKATFSPDERYVVLQVGQSAEPQERFVVEIAGLPGTQRSWQLPAAQEASWLGTCALIFTRDAGFGSLGQVGSWSPAAQELGQQPPMAITNWSYVQRLQADSVHDQAAVLSQHAATIDSRGRRDVHAAVHFLRLTERGPLSPPDAHHVVELTGQQQLDPAAEGLLAWAPEGDCQGYLAVALPDSRSLWLLDSLSGHQYQLATDLGSHRWLGWAPCGQYLLATDILSPSSAQRLPGGPRAQLRIYQMGRHIPIFQERQHLSAQAASQTTWAFADRDVQRVIWMLPHSIETIDFDFAA